MKSVTKANTTSATNRLASRTETSTENTEEQTQLGGHTKTNQHTARSLIHVGMQIAPDMKIT
jgi:hypothetical protein